MDAFFSMKVWDEAQKKEVTWAPTNANGYFYNTNMYLKAAFAQSINSVAVRVGQEVGIDRVAKTAHDMGIKSKLDETPALALGSSDVNLAELVNAYATVINDGKYRPYVLVTRIEDRDGNVIYTVPDEETEAIPYRSAFLMQQMLMAGMREPGGTSMNLWSYVRNFADREFGGKTGTSNNHSDAWFIGVTPRLVVGVWVGGDYRSIHFRTGMLGQGNRTALPICGYFLGSVLNDPAFKKYRTKFAPPRQSDLTSDMYDCGGYFKAPADSDSIGVDSLAVDVDDEAIFYDDFGNPLQRPAKDPEPDNADNTQTPQHNADATKED
jgi:penicillin-binding protein 1A